MYCSDCRSSTGKKYPLCYHVVLPYILLLHTYTHRDLPSPFKAVRPPKERQRQRQADGLGEGGREGVGFRLSSIRRNNLVHLSSLKQFTFEVCSFRIAEHRLFIWNNLRFHRLIETSTFIARRFRWTFHHFVVRRVMVKRGRDGGWRLWVGESGGAVTDGQKDIGKVGRAEEA